MELTISNLTKTYPNGVRALDNVSLTIPSGMFGLLGPNGAGKSTLMRTIATLQDADSGSIMFDGIDVLTQKDDMRKILGYLPQEFGFYPNLSAEATLDHFATLKGLTNSKERAEIVANLLQQTNLYEARKKRMGGFSGGMRQRLGIAVALIGSPKLIIVDEPTAGLDPTERNRFLNLLSEIGENVVVILSTHIVEDVQELCSNVAIISNGKVVAQGSPEDVLQTLAGKIWRMAVAKTALEDAKRNHHVISTRMIAGRPIIFVHSDTCPADGFTLVEPGLEEAFFFHTTLSPTEHSANSSRRAQPMWQVLKFELKYRAAQPSTYFFFLIMFALSFLFVATDVVQVGGGGDNIFFNSPFTIARVTSILAAVGTMMISAIVGTAIYRDFEVNVHELFFTTPMKKFDYLMGRFVGSYLWALVIFSGILWGLFIGAHMPWVDQTRIGQFHFNYYWQPFIVFVVPDVLFLSCFVFTLGMLTRSLLAIYAQGTLIFIGYSIALSMVRNLDNRSVASLIDAFGITPLMLTTRYWTQVERNTQTVHFDGYLLWNRLLWMGIGLIVLAVGYSLFTFSSSARTLSLRKQPAAKLADEAPSHAIDLSALSGTMLTPSTGTQFARLVRSYFTDSIRSIAFIMIAGFGIVNVIINASYVDQIDGTSIYPVTRIMVDLMFGSFVIFFLILITVYAGELTWKERVLKLDQVQDALPIPTWLAYAAKLTTVLCMMLVLLAALALAGMGVQIAKGYYNFQLPLYASYLLFYAFPDLILLTVGAFFVHALVNNKFLGHVIVIVSFVASLALPAAGLEHHLIIYASGPNLQLSDMNDYGPYVAPIFWFYAYWFAFAGLLAIGTLLLWVRGTEASFKQRLEIAKSRIDNPIRISAAISLVAFIAIGGFIYYNTCVLNVFRTTNQQKQLTADFEKTYKHWENVPMPRITDRQHPNRHLS